MDLKEFDAYVKAYAAQPANGFTGMTYGSAIYQPMKEVFEYLKANNGKDLTAADVAAELGLEKRSVDGIFTSAIQRKGLGVRTPAEVELEDGSHKGIKLLSLTAEGMAFDPDQADEAK